MIEYYMTVGDLKKRLEDIPDTVKVVYQRIDDFYFNENHWEPIKIIDSEYSHREDYTPEDDVQTVPVWDGWLAEGRDGKMYFFLTAHY